MKVLLVNPPAENTIVADNPSFIDEERGVNPPLGLLYLAAYLREDGGHEVEILDMPVEEMGYGRLPGEIRRRSPDVVGITAMTFTMIDVMKTVRIVKSVSPDARVVLGGPHASIYPRETVDLAEVDFVIAGEGERLFVHLLNNMDNPAALSQREGIYLKADGRVLGSGRGHFIEDLDNLPFPARNLTPYQKYSSILTGRGCITTMITSRGCPFHCTFCYKPQMGRCFRARSYNNVVDEMEECIDMGITEILVYDDSFTLDRQRALDICDEIMKRGLHFAWDIRTRVDTVDEEMLAMLKRAGCTRIHYGVEAGTDKILGVLNKGITLKQVRDTFAVTKKVGITTLAYFMIGSPEETYEDILATVAFVKEIDPDYLHLTLTTPFPLTDLYRRALDEGVIEYDYWREFARNPEGGVTTRYWEKNLSRERLLELMSYAYRSFYGRPRYIARNLCQIKSLGDLYRKAKTGLKILSS